MNSPTVESMRVEREELNPCTVVLKVTCSSEQVQSAVKKAVKALSKRIKVHGFRPGSAPSGVLEKMLSPADIDAAAQEETINSSFKKAIESEGLEIIDQAQIQSVVFDRAEDKCEYTVKVPLAPKVELGDYKGLEAEKYRAQVTEEEIDRQIGELRSRSGKKKAVERGGTEGDSALVNIKPEGADGDGLNFMVVVGQTFPDLDALLVGMKTDDIKSAEIEFPESFSETELAGTRHQCLVTVRSVSAVELPDLDDAFAKALNVESLEELKGRIREGMLRAKEQMAQEMVNERLLGQLLARSTVHVADNQWERVAENRLAEVRAELEKQGVSLADYAKGNGMDEQQFISAQKEEARTQVQRAVLLQKVFEAEGMTITDSDRNEQFLRVAYENRVAETDLKKFAREFGPQIRDEIVYRTLYAKVMAMLNESAKIAEVDAPIPRQSG